MSENNFKPGDIVRHVQFDFTDLFVVRILPNGVIGCRYHSFHHTPYGNSEYILHYAEFEAFELKHTGKEMKSS